ncbi:MAG TPA: TOBE domain-containing protein [Candidatus Limnocylindria bacterium]
MKPALRIGQAAEILGVSVDTIRRWAADGTLKTRRSAGGQRLVAAAEVSRMLGARRKSVPERSISAQSARNRLPGVVTKVVADRVAATVEVQAGPYRLLSLLTAEAVRELKLKPGVQVIAVVKATNVIVEVPS